MKTLLLILLVLYVIKCISNLYFKYGRGINIDNMINMLEKKIDKFKQLKTRINEEILNSTIMLSFTLEAVLSIFIIFLAIKGLYTI